jgi:hypothetical protein
MKRYALGRRWLPRQLQSTVIYVNSQIGPLALLFVSEPPHALGEGRILISRVDHPASATSVGDRQVEQRLCGKPIGRGPYERIGRLSLATRPVGRVNQTLSMQ